MELLLEAGASGAVEALASAKSQHHGKVVKIIKAAIKTAAEADAEKERAGAVRAAEWDAANTVKTVLEEVDAASEELVRAERVKALSSKFEEL